MKIKIVFAVVALAYAPLALAGENTSYPSEKIAGFIVEKLDLTSLPSAIRPKKEKGKKTLADYGYTVQKIEENEALVTPADGSRQLSFKVLTVEPVGIYACITEQGRTRTQNVVLLKRKDPNALLKGRESVREFASCPVIGGSDSPASSY